MRPARIGVLFLLFVISACPVVAQITNVTADQTPPIPGAGHDYIHLLNETVNPVTGSVSIRIELPVPPGRGITVPFAITYDSNAARHLGGTAWGDNVAYLARGGWTYLLPRLVNQIQHIQWTQTPPPYDCQFSNDFVFNDLEGRSHSLAMAVFQVATQPPAGCTYPLNPPTSIASGGDDFVKSIATTSGSLGFPYYVFPVTVAEGDGSVYYFSGSHPHYPPSGEENLPDWIEDRNGNKVVYNDSSYTGAFSLADTLGRTLLSSNGFGTSGNTITVAGLTPYTVTWGTATYNTQYADTLTNQSGLNYPCIGFGQTAGTFPEITAIALPNGRSYQFQYDPSSGLLSKIIYPSGGYIRYVWGTNHSSDIREFSPDSNGNFTCAGINDTPALLNRFVSFDGTTEVQQQDFTNYVTHWVPDSLCSNCQKWTTKTVNVTTHDLVLGTSFETDYTYSPVGVTNQPNSGPFKVISGALQWAPTQPLYFPVEQTVVYKSTSGSTLLTSTKAWGDQYLIHCQLQTLDNGQISGTFYTYGTGGVVTDKKEYEFGQITSTSACQLGSTAPASPSRETIITYQTLSNTPIYPSGPSIFDRPATIKTNSSGTLVAETDYVYDVYAGGISPVTAFSHDDSNYPTTYTNRGNPTKITHKCLGCASNAVLTYAYFNTGQVQNVTDPCGNSSCGDMATGSHTTTYSYLDSFDSPPSTNTNAYLTQITDALGHISKFKYAYSDGQLIESNDQNNQVTDYSYSDTLRRLTQVQLPADPNNGGTRGTTTYSYSDTGPSPSVTTTQLMNTAGQYIVSTKTMDGVGHVVKALLTSDPDCASGDRADTTYDGLERVHTVSNPYCTTSDSTYGLTTYAYDALGRTTSVTHPDSTTIATNYTGRATQVQDEGYDNSGHRITRISQVDSLGRLASLCEVAPGPFVGSGGASSATLIGTDGTPVSCNLDFNIGSPKGFLTSYLYDGNSNLKTVNQGATSSRSFVYDSLSRLTSASNPESGTTTYTYDLNGNLSTKTAPSANLATGTVTTTYTYDVLNRNTQKTYNDGTPTATFFYDGPNAPYNNHPVTNPVGRLVQATGAANGCAVTVNYYDVMGRISQQLQQTPVTCLIPTAPYYTMPYAYDLAGHMTSSSNGYFTTFTYGYNIAGRITSVTSNLNDQWDPGALMSAGKYNAFGAMVSDTLGDTETQTFTYDKRLRRQASTSSYNSSSIYSYNLAFAPNSDVLTANDSVNGNWAYSYDQFNRLIGSNKNSGAAIYSYVYDRFGNRWEQDGPPPNPTASFNNSNKIVGYSYSASGNLIGDGFHTYSYDAENRLTAVNGGGTSATYTYDAFGHRVGRTGYTGGACDTSGIVYYVYNLDGNYTAALNSGGGGCNFEIVYAGNRHLASYEGGTIFPHSDWLGTERMRVNYSYVSTPPYQTCTSLPFGDALSCANGSDPSRYSSPLHFTGKEHDYESNLENFGARYDSSNLGRFLSPDSPSYSNRKNPQSWNLYAYALNNPVSYRDADGHEIVCANNAEQCKKDAAAATANAEAAKRVTTNTVTTQHSFLGKKWTTSKTTIGITGDIKSFAALSPNAAKLAGLVSDSRTVTVSYDQTARASSWDTGFALHGGSASYVNPFLAIIDPTRTQGAVYDQDAVDQHIPQSNTGEEFAHEVLGHIWGDMLGGAPAGTRANMRDSIASEDAVRALDPARGQKALESHHNYNEMPADPPKPQ